MLKPPARRYFLAGIFAVIFIIASILILFFTIYRNLQSSNANATATAIAQETATASAYASATVNVQATSTQFANATPTAIVQATATAEANATATAIGSNTTPTTVPNTPTPILIVNLNPSALQIITDTPSLMQVHQSYIVKVSLVPQGQSYVSNIVIEKATPTASEVIPNGTPNRSLKTAFGPGYEPYATATLSPGTGPLLITPIPPTVQSLEQQEIVWKWTVIPQDVGTQILDVDIEATWESSIYPQQGPYRIGDKQFAVDITPPPSTPTPSPTPEPFFIPGQINIGELITSLVIALLGAGGLGALFIVWLVNRARRQNAPSPRSHRAGRRNRRH